MNTWRELQTVFAYAMPRYPSPHAHDATSFSDMSESMIASSIMQVSRRYYCISWKRIAAETQKDSSKSALLNILKSPNDEKQEIKPELSEYAEYLDSLYVTGDVILYRDRAVIPSSLKKTCC